MSQRLVFIARIESSRKTRPKLKGQKMPIKIRPIRICGDVAYVPLTHGYEAIIDAADVPLVRGWNWYASVRTHSIYASRTVRHGTKSRKIYLHRLIMSNLDGLQVDHADGDGLNNIRDNLRLVTASQNSCNRRVLSSIASGLKGAYFDKKSGKFSAQIKIKNKRKYLGYFSTPEEAHAAYCRASEKYHGEFGRTE
jgi:hypothetical protein